VPGCSPSLSAHETDLTNPSCKPIHSKHKCLPDPKEAEFLLLPHLRRPCCWCWAAEVPLAHCGLCLESCPEFGPRADSEESGPAFAFPEAAPTPIWLPAQKRRCWQRSRCHHAARVPGCRR